MLDAVVAVVSESSSSSAAGGPQSSKVLKPSCATSNPALQETNTLHEIDQAAQVGSSRRQGRRRVPSLPAEGSCHASAAPDA